MTRRATERDVKREKRVERITWFLMVLPFFVLSVVDADAIPPALVPLVIAGFLFASGIYQLMKRWPVNPSVWIAGGLLIAVGGYNLGVDPNFDVVLPTLIGVVAVIVLGIITNQS